MNWFERARMKASGKLLDGGFRMVAFGLDIGGDTAIDALVISFRHFFSNPDTRRRWLGEDLPLRSTTTQDHVPATARARGSISLVGTDSAELRQRARRDEVSGEEDRGADRTARSGLEAVPEKDASGGAGLSVERRAEIERFVAAARRLRDDPPTEQGTPLAWPSDGALAAIDLWDALEAVEASDAA